MGSPAQSLTIVYEGPGLAGKTTSIGCVARRLGVSTVRWSDAPHAVGVEARCGDSSFGLVVAALIGATRVPESHERLRARADAFVLVADSQNARWLANEECAEQLAEAFARMGHEVPVVLQCNKRDLSSSPFSASELDPIERLARLVEPWNGSVHTSTATRCEGAWPAFVDAATRAARRRGIERSLEQFLAGR